MKLIRDLLFGARRILLLFVLLALVPCIVLLQRHGTAWVIPGEDASPGARLESYVSRNFPKRKMLQEWHLSLLLLGGKQEQGGVFITENGLMKNIGGYHLDITEENIFEIQRVASYASELEVPVYMTLIPTACAIRQEELPGFADVFNQRQFIEDTYSRMYGRVSTVDVYTPLFAARSQYLYFRTENGLTATGGFHVYEALAERMGLSGHSINQYDVTYVADEYYGSLYQLAPYKKVNPDLLMLYHYNTPVGGRSYTVTHLRDRGRAVYRTLYPETEQDMDIYLGGISPVIHIDTAYHNRDLLLIGDETALAYLPLLCNHYRRVTFVNSLQDESIHSSINLGEYGQVLFAYSVENYSSNEVLPQVDRWLVDDWDPDGTET